VRLVTADCDHMKIDSPCDSLTLWSWASNAVWL